MKALLALTLAVLAAAAAGVSFASPPGTEVLVTRDSLSLPAGCSPRQVADVVVNFLQAVNTGSEAQVERALAAGSSPGLKPPLFQWLSVSGPPDGHFVAYSRSEAVRYLTNRHAHHERLQLRQLDVGRSWVYQSVAVGFLVTREAGDFGQSGPQAAYGKAEIHCPTKTIYVWTMGFGKASFCPVPAGWGPPSAPVVCARGGTATTADEIAPRYRQSASSLPLPGRCRPGAVEGRVLRMLRAFNIGNGTAFAESFAGADARGSVRLRVGGINKFSTRSALSDFARGRYQAGDGWTLVALSPPNHIDGPYRLQVGVFGRDRAPHASSGKLRVDCRTGLIRRLALPGIGA